MPQQNPSLFRKALLFYSIVIIVLAVLPLNSTSVVLNHTYIISIRLDYLVHFAVFIPWMFLVWQGKRVSFKTDFKKAILWILIGLLFASSSEGLQYFLTYRSFNINDLLGNSIGILLGSCFFAFQNRKS